jgi:hypothetical protein
MDLRRVVVNTIGGVANKFIPFSGPVTEGVLSDLLRVQDEQLAVLQDIQQSLKDFMNGPWQAAQMHMQEAALPGRQPEQIRRSLVQAADKLHDAIPLLKERTVARAQARLDLAIILTLLADRAPSLLHAQIAYREIREATWTFTHTPDPNNKRITRGERKKGILVDGSTWAGLAWPNIAKWYKNAEYCSGALGDPDGYEVLSAKARSDPRRWAAKGPYEYDGQLLAKNLRIAGEQVQWREGVPVDFAYIEYKQRIFQYAHSDWDDQWVFCRLPFSKVLEPRSLDAGAKTKKEFRINYELKEERRKRYGEGSPGEF